MRGLIIPWSEVRVLVGPIIKSMSYAQSVDELESCQNPRGMGDFPTSTGPNRICMITNCPIFWNHLKRPASDHSPHLDYSWRVGFFADGGRSCLKSKTIRHFNSLVHARHE